MISVVILTKNEEEHIVDCLESLSWCDEIVVIDDNSSDLTVELARKFTEHVFLHSLNDDFSAQRNFGLDKATGDWVLFIDADERVSEVLKKEIIYRTQDSQNNAFRIQRLDVVWGKTLCHGETGNISFVRLAKKGTGTWKGSVHEVWEVGEGVNILDNSLIHYPFRNYSEFLEKINFYSSLRAKELYDKNIMSSFLDISFYPKAKFFQNYILKFGFLDGLPGLIHAITMSFHSFLTRAKLWQLYNS